MSGGASYTAKKQRNVSAKEKIKEESSNVNSSMINSSNNNTNYNNYNINNNEECKIESNY
jgi:hypothetical protein